MNKLECTKHSLDLKAYRFRRATDADYGQLITESTEVFVDNQLRIHFEVLPEVPASLLGALQRITYGKSYRTEGLLTQSRVLGNQPRVTLRRDFCTAAGLANDNPVEHETLLDWGQRADKVYRQVNPELYAKHLEHVAKVKPSWMLRDTVFTSGIANKDNALFYHLDSGNFKNVWSAMYALSLDCSGGNLSVPELGIGFSFERPALIMFDGQGLIHGVTPLEKKSKAAYRYSVVYYALQQMTKCGTLDEELTRIRKVKTQRELKRGRKAE
jgi:2-oxoglutarate-Fe(II)-dependent dioxygenase family protein